MAKNWMYGNLTFKRIIPGTGEPDGLPSMGSHRVGHDWSDLAAAAAAGKKKIVDSRKRITWSNRMK